MKTKMIVMICCLTALLLLSACGSGGNSPDLAESSWQLIRLPGYTDLGPVDVSLIFGADGSIGGNGGCNSYGGAYQADAADGTIMFSEIFSIEMY